MFITQFILNVVPTVIMYFILVHSKRWIDDLNRAREPGIQANIIKATCVSIMGFNTIALISSLYIEQPLNVNQVTAPIIYVYAVFFSPIFEELICRKVIQDQLNKHIQNNYSIIVSAAIFSVLHFNLALFLGYLFIGIVWGYYYKKTNNIFVPIMSHFLFNYFALLIQSF